MVKIEEEEAGKRLDKVLVSRFPQRTREFFRRLALEGHVTVNGKPAKPAFILKSGDKVYVVIPDSVEMKATPLPMDLDIVYEDSNILVLNKPVGLVVHPGAGNSHLDDSLVSGILHHCKGQLSGINGVMRPGIVHRLDKDTSGLLVVAKNDMAHQSLSKQFENRTVEKVYFALLCGHLEPPRGTIDSPLARDSHHRTRMAVVSGRYGKAAVTKYEVVQYYRVQEEKVKGSRKKVHKKNGVKAPEFTLVKVNLLTGRTHQIRVHFSAIGYPLVGDDLYGRQNMNKKFEQWFGLKRQFLHAAKLSFDLPVAQNQEKSAPVKVKAVRTKVQSAPAKSKKSPVVKRVSFEAPLPDDLKAVLKGLF